MFSNVGVNIIFASVGGGRGVVVDKQGKETFMRMGTAGLGIGLGAKDFRGVFIFWDEDKLAQFLEKGWDFSGQAGAAKTTEMGGEVSMAVTVLPGVELYQFTAAGLALQATWQGTEHWQDKRLNCTSQYVVASARSTIGTCAGWANGLACASPGPG